MQLFSDVQIPSELTWLKMQRCLPMFAFFFSLHSSFQIWYGRHVGWWSTTNISGKPGDLFILRWLLTYFSLMFSRCIRRNCFYRQARIDWIYTSLNHCHIHLYSLEATCAVKLLPSPSIISLCSKPSWYIGMTELLGLLPPCSPLHADLVNRSVDFRNHWVRLWS